MTRIFEVDPDRIDRGALESAVEALISGGLVIFPTETVYGLAARPDDRAVTDRVFEVKGRPRSLNLPVLAASTAQAWDAGRPTVAAATLAGALWPGPLTLIVPRTDRSASWSLGDRADTVALRVPDHRLSRAVLQACGPLAVTSANPSGEQPLNDRKQLEEAFGGRVDVILVLAPGASAPSGTPSTVVDCTGPDVTVVRSGMLGSERIHEILAKEESPQDQ